MSAGIRRPLSGLLAVVSLVGLVTAGVLTEHKVDSLCGTASEHWCDINATFNCGAVTQSEFSVIAGIPVSIPGLGFFLMALGLSVWSLFSDEERRDDIAAVLFGAAIPAMAFGLYLMARMAFSLNTFCLNCLILDAATLAVLVVAPLTGRGGYAGAWGRAVGLLGQLTKPVVIAAIVVLIGTTAVAQGAYINHVQGCAGYLASRGAGPGTGPGGPADNDDQELTAEQIEAAQTLALDAISVFHRNQQMVDLGMTGEEPRKGSPQPLVEIVEFADFQCPFCQLASFAVKDLEERYGRWVRVTFKHYPLNQACNPPLSRDMHPLACRAAVAADCAGQSGRFWEMHDMLFLNNRALDRSDLLAYGEELGLDRDGLAACIDDPASMAALTRDVANSREQLGIRGTPTFYVNDKLLDGSHPLKLEAVVRYELERQGITGLPADEDGFFPEPGTAVQAAAAHTPPPPRGG